MKEEINQLRSLPLFSSLQQEEFLDLLSQSTLKTARRGQLIFKNKSTPDQIGIILDGEVKVCRAEKNGKELQIALIGANGYIGLVAAITGKNRNTDIIATCKSKYITFNSRTFFKIMHRNTKASQLLLKLIAERLYETTQHFYANSIYDLEQRLILRLFKMAIVVKLRNRDVLLVRQRPAHQELADMLGVTREAITRSLKHLEKKRHIRILDNQIQILSSPINIS